MSATTDALLLKVVGALEDVTARLDALETRSVSATPAEEFPDWNEDPGSVPHLSVVPDPEQPPSPSAAPSGAETATPAPRALSPASAAAQFQVPAAPGLEGGIQGDNGTMIRPPTSDMPIVAGAPGGNTMTKAQLDACYQREVVAQRRMRPIEDAV